MVESVDAEAPANLTVASSEELRQLPGTNLDTRLRMVPGFSLFRRFSSVAAHPTTPGVSLRGIGPTAARRTLVRWDRVPV
ncbi:MAG: Plug domain-containing protein, partial [bacterium]|nr:Plug domain-containing protein [bacterium]